MAKIIYSYAFSSQLSLLKLMLLLSQLPTLLRFLLTSESGTTSSKAIQLQIKMIKGLLFLSSTLLTQKIRRLKMENISYLIILILIPH